MNVVLMKGDSDCEISALATATGKTYDEVLKAEGRKELPFGLNDPVWGNPETLYLTLNRLGFWKRNVTLTMLQNQKAEVGKTVVLVHKPAAPLTDQHWIVLAGYRPDGYLFYWGTQEQPVFVPRQDFEGSSGLFRGGWPNCAFQVIRDTAWMRFLRWLGIEK